MLILLYASYIITFIWFTCKRTNVLMQFFQQEEYDNKRFLWYIIKHPNLIDKKLSLALVTLALLTLIYNNIAVHLGILIIMLIMFALLQCSYLKNSKKPLKVTPRVGRLFTVTVLIACAILNALFFHQITTSWVLYVVSILFIQSTPLLIICANIVLFPVEKTIQLKYLKEARAKLAKCDSVIIGITGSYGKTSTKHILAHILSSVAPTLATPGSINTTMGITRIIREQLKPEHKFFIVEMGAYAKGSIAKLCKLTPPTYGIVTSIGNAHFERFKSIANVAQAKFELVDAVRQKQGSFVVVNSDAIDQKFIGQYCDEATITVETSKDHSAATYTITQAKQTLTGISFQICCGNACYSVNTNLYGLHHVGNMALCFAFAHKIGVAAETIIAALAHTPQIQHRLEVIKEKAKPIIIDDAYNSNPVGFAAALEVLKTFKENGHRCIIVTPGMVELGALHDEKHFELGQKAAQIVDYALVVIPGRIQAFIDGFNSQASNSNNQKLLTFNTFSEAKAWLDANAQSTDVILFENDLPDLYEARIRL